MIDLLDLTLLAPPFTFAPDVVGPEPTADFRTALRARLLAAGGLEALEGRIFWSTQRSAAFPHMRIFPIGPDRKEENTDDPGPFWRTIQFSVLAADDVECEEITRSAYEAMAWDVSDPLEFAEGVEIARHPDDPWLPQEQEGDGPGGADIWHAHFDVDFYLEKR